MMKVSVRRNGIVLRVVEVRGDRARIGNSADSDIVIDDSYLSPHVADFVLRDGEWRVVDAGKLEGVRKGGARIDDEPLLSGSVYTVGGFELIPEFGAAPAALHGDGLPPAYVPATIMAPRAAMTPQAGAEFLPQTVMATSPAKAPFAVGFEPVAAPATAAAPSATPPRRRLLLMVSAALGVGIVLMLLVAVIRKPQAKPAEMPVAETATTAATPPPPDAATQIRAGEKALAALDYDRGLELWEEAMKSSPDPELRRRYADVAVDVGRALMARGESARGAEYLEKAIRYGPGDAAAVAAARRALHGRTTLTE